MKKAILLSLPIGLIMAAMPGTRVQAQGQMVVYSKSNPLPSTWQLDQLMSLHFDNERLYVQPKTIGTTAFSLADVRCIKFAAVVNALQTLNAGSDKLAARLSGGTLQVTGWSSGATRAALFTASGTQVLVADNWAGEPLDVSALPAGLYILKIKNYSLKFIK